MAVSIPKELGLVTYRQVPANAWTAIACIQDLHGNVDVQERIADIIQLLVSKHNYTHVFAEGAAGPIDLEIQSEGPQAARSLTARLLLNEALLTGTELASIRNTRLDYELLGVDDVRLFTRHREAAEALELSRPHVLSGTKSFRAEIDRVFQPFISADLSDLISIGRSVPNASTAEVITGLLVQLSALASSYYVAMPPGLRAAMREFGLMCPPPTEPISGSNWRSEITPVLDDLAQSIADRLQGTVREFDRQTWLLLKTVDLVEEAFQCHLDRESAQRFFAFDSSALSDRVVAHVSWLNGHVDRNAGECVIPEAFLSALSQWNLPLEFYRMAIERSDKMALNVNMNIKRFHVKGGILVAGGFHTDYIAQTLASRFNHAVFVIRPQVQWIDETAVQRRRLDRLKPVSTDVYQGSSPLRLALPAAIERLSRPLRSIVAARRRGAATELICAMLRLRGDEQLLEVGATESDLFTRVSRKLTSGFVVAGDRFDVSARQHIVGAGDLVRIKRKAETEGSISRISIVNLDVGFVNFVDEVFDGVFAMSFGAVARLTSRRKALLEFARVLRPSGVVVVFAPGSEDSCARFLLETGQFIVGKIRRARWQVSGIVIGIKLPIGRYLLDLRPGYDEFASVEGAAVCWRRSS